MTSTFTDNLLLVNISNVKCIEIAITIKEFLGLLRSNGLNFNVDGKMIRIPESNIPKFLREGRLELSFYDNQFAYICVRLIENG